MIPEYLMFQIDAHRQIEDALFGDTWPPVNGKNFPVTKGESSGAIAGVAPKSGIDLSGSQEIGLTNETDRLQTANRPLQSGGDVLPAQNNLPVPVLAEPSDNRGADGVRFKARPTDSVSGEARESTEANSNIRDVKGGELDSRGGQNHFCTCAGFRIASDCPRHAR